MEAIQKSEANKNGLQRELRNGGSKIVRCKYCRYDVSPNDELTKQRAEF